MAIQFNILAHEGIAKNGKLYIESEAGKFAAGDVLEQRVEITEGRRSSRRVVGEKVISFKITGTGSEFADNFEDDRQRYYGERSEEETRF